MSFSCAMAFMIFGYDAGVLGGVQGTKPFLDALKITDQDLERSPFLIPMIASSYTLGCFILVGDAFVVVGGAIQASSYSVGQTCCGRVLVGLGIGMISATVPTYMAETTIEVKERGPQAAIQWARCQSMCCANILARYWVDLGMIQVNHGPYVQVPWRFPISLMSFFTLISFIIMLVLPDTPRWYYARGRIEDGDRVLSMLYAKPIEDFEVQHTRAEILQTLQLEEDEGRIQLSDWIWDRSPIQSARRIKTSFMLLALHQFMGINIVVYYSTVILGQTGLSPLIASTIAGVANTIFFLGTVATYFTIERWGRRSLLTGPPLAARFVLQYTSQ
ncbi:hypothetical protein LTR28_000118 [Elasticomyces elasticus]|nr:hypothetical protein LTR28_000118 [Elasticomyces elasticus]